MIPIEATPSTLRLANVLALIDRITPADRVRLREEDRVRYDAGEEDGVVDSPPHRLRH